jgi:hypothetical protein
LIELAHAAMHRDDEMRLDQANHFDRLGRVDGHVSADRYEKHVDIAELTELLGSWDVAKVAQMADDEIVDLDNVGRVFPPLLATIGVVIRRDTFDLDALDFILARATEDARMAGNRLHLIVAGVLVAHGYDVRGQSIPAG